MNFTTSKENLLNGLKNVVGIANERTTMPILSCVMLDVAGGKLNIYGSNLDISMDSVVDVEMKQEGKLCVNASKLQAIVKELKNVPMTVSATESTLKIESDSGVYKIAGISHEEFPKMPVIEGGVEIEIDFNVLRDVFRRVTFCVNEHDTRKELSGVNVVIKGRKLTVVGTDGHKLSKIERAVTTEKECNIIVPKDTIEMFNKIGDGNKVTLYKNFIMFKAGNTTLYSRLLEGPYPNYMQVIPTQNNKVMTVDREAFVSALKRVKVFTGDNEMVKLDIGTGVMNMSAVNRDTMSEGIETIKVSSDFGMVIGFNNRILAEVVGAIWCDELIFKLLDGRCSGLIFPSKDIEGETWFMLIMPCLLND